MEPSKPLEKTKDNLIEITSEKPESEIEFQRRAELTLLTQMERLPSRQLKRQFCMKFGVPWDEYQLLCKKWKHLLTYYRKELKEKGEANIINLDTVREVKEIE